MTNEDRRTHTDIENTTQNTIVRTTLTRQNLGEPRFSERTTVPASHVAPVLILLLQTRWQVMKQEMNGL